jgi:colicin import membrane protein
MSSQTLSTPSPIKVTTPKAPVKVVKEKDVKEKVVAAKAEKVVKEKVVAAKAEKVVAAKAEKVVKEKVVKVVAAKAEKVVAAKAEKVEAKQEETKPDAAKEKVVKEKKVRAAALPAKWNKFIQYTYYMLRSLNNAELAKNGEVLFDEEKMFEAANVFGEVEAQKAFVEGFLENKGIAKEMRTHLVDKQKEEKTAAKQKVADDKAAAKKKAIDDKAAAKQAVADAKTAKKGAGATKKKGKPVDLVTSLVTLANSSIDEIHTGVPAEDEEADADADADADEEEEELDVKVIEIDGKQYLIDDSNNLYDNVTHSMFGTWNCVTKVITHV